jgi:hypothetical protein
MGFKPKFKRQEVTEEDLEGDEEIEEEEFEEEVVPKPQYEKSIISKQVRKPEPKPIQPQVSQPIQPLETWRVEEATTQTQPVIYNSKNKKIYTFYEALAELLNRTEQ